MEHILREEWYMTPLYARRRSLLVPLLIVALLWSAALYAFQRTHRSTDLQGVTPVRPEFAGIAGINLDETELLDPQLIGRLDQLADGVHWVRFALPWDALEPAPGQYDWARWDALFAGLAARPDLMPVVVLDRAPAWARAAADAENPAAPPHERRDFGAYAAAVAARYGG